MSPDAYCNSSFAEINEVTLRFLVPEDIEQVKELCHEWFPVEYPSFWYECITETSQYYALAAIHADIIVGLLVAQTKPLCDINEEDAQMLRQARLFGGNVGYILTLGVRRQHRRQGLASLLLNQYIEHLRLDCSRKYAKHRRHETKCEDKGTVDGGNGSDGRMHRRSPAADTERGFTKKKQASTAGRGGDRRKNKSSRPERSKNNSGSDKNNTLKNGRTIFESTLNEIKQDAVVINVGISGDDNFDGVSSQGNLISEVSDEYRESNSSNVLLQSENQDCLVDLGVTLFSREVQELSLECSKDTQGSAVTENQNNSVINTVSNSSLIYSSNDLSGMCAAVGEVHHSVSHHKPNANMSRSHKSNPNFVRSMLLNSPITNNGETIHPPLPSLASASSSCSSSRSSVEITMESGASPWTDRLSNSIDENVSSPPLRCPSSSHSAILSSSSGSESGLSSADSFLREEGAEVLTSTLNASYIVETSLLCSSVLQRVQCSDEVYAAAPVTAILLHVLTTNASAIRFYSSRHFARQAFLPMFYVINNERRDGYSYVLYINGGQPSPGFSLFPRPFQQLARPFGSSLSQLAQPLADQVGKMSQWLLGGVGGSGSGGLLSVLVGGMVGVLGKVVSSVVTMGRRT